MVMVGLEIYKFRRLWNREQQCNCNHCFRTSLAY